MLGSVLLAMLAYLVGRQHAYESIRIAQSVPAAVPTVITQVVVKKYNHQYSSPNPVTQTIHYISAPQVITAQPSETKTEIAPAENLPAPTLPSPNPVAPARAASRNTIQPIWFPPLIPLLPDFKTKLGQDTYIQIAGIGNLRDAWIVNGQLISGTGNLSAQSLVQTGQISASFRVLVPIRSLHTGVGSNLDEVFYHWLNTDKSSEFGKIRCDWDVINITQPLNNQLTAEGEAYSTLVIRGLTNRVTLPLTIQVLNSSEVIITSRFTTHISDYGLQPPEFLVSVGKVRIEDTISVAVSWRFFPSVGVLRQASR